MEKLIGKIVKIEVDQVNIWFSLKVKLTSGISPSEQEVYFDCRITKIDDNEIDYLKVLGALEMAKNTTVELDGYMLIDNPEDDEMQMWFSVFKLKIGDNLVYDTPCPQVQYVLS
jgi:hypothetical protein